MIPGDLLRAFPHRQFHTLPGPLDSWAALPNSYPNALRATQGGSLYHFYDGLWYDPAERRTHDLPCERWTRYRLSQPDMVAYHDRAATLSHDAIVCFIISWLKHFSKKNQKMFHLCEFPFQSIITTIYTASKSVKSALWLYSFVKYLSFYIFGRNFQH